MRRLWVVWLILLMGCASVPAARPPVFPADALAQADRLVAEGCYTCLIDARDLFANVAAGPFRADVLPALFETQLLLVLRHKELAMPLETVLAEATRTAAELPEDQAAARYLALVGAVGEDVVGGTERERRAFATAHDGFKNRLAAEASWAEQGPLGQRVGLYLSIALRCAWDQPAAARAVSSAAAPDELPLMSYRRAICGDSPDLARLASVLERVPDFHEALYYSARGWLDDLLKFGFSKPALAVLEVLPRFPMSPSVTFTAGGIQRARRLCDEALALYDQTLALRPGHERAVLGRVECLSRLKRHEAAIAEATRLIGLGGSELPTGYYWRAWNQHTLGRLSPARQDIDSAKRAGGADVNVVLLAGVIEHDQDDLDQALVDLRLALALSRGRACLAHWYIALVNVKRTNWTESATRFEGAMTCYEQTVRDSRFELAALESNTEVAADYKAELVRALKAAIVDDEAQRHIAAINAAKGFATTGNFAAAVRLGTIALEDPSLASEVQVLRDYLTQLKAPLQLPEAIATSVR